jgi:two-component system response regulator NreC
MIRLLLVDDHLVVRTGLRMLLSARSDMEVVGEASEGNVALRLAEQCKPDVVIMDLSMPHGKDGLLTTGEMKKWLPEVAILILTMHDDEEYLFRTIQAGASGFVLKSSPHDELIAAIHCVAQGNAYLNPNATKRLMQDYLEKLKRGESFDAYGSLSDREKEVLALIARGYGNKEMAEQMNVSVKTIETHKSNLMEKLQLRTRPELVKYAVKRGLLNY